MTDFTDFEKVLAAANEDLRILKAQAAKTQTCIDEIERDEYTEFYDYFLHLYDVAHNIGASEYNSPEAWFDTGLGFFISTQIRCTPLDSISSFAINRGEITLICSLTPGRTEPNGVFAIIIPTIPYRKHYASQQSKDALSRDFAVPFEKKYKAVEPTISKNFKEAITKVMAEKIRRAEQEARLKANELNAKIQIHNYITK